MKLDFTVVWSPGVVASGWAYLFLSLSVDSASLAQPCAISKTLSSNHTFSFPEYGFPIISSRGIRSGLPKNGSRHLVEHKLVQVIGYIYVVPPLAFATFPHGVSPYPSLKIVFDVPQLYATVAITEVVLPASTYAVEILDDLLERNNDSPPARTGGFFNHNINCSCPLSSFSWYST
jgi:hypothetical protein